MKYVINIIAIGVVALLVFGAIKFKESRAYNVLSWHFQNFSQRIKNFIAVKKHNIGMEIAPPRKTPITFTQYESELQNWMPEIFDQFSQQDWREFWSLVYKPIKVKEGKFMVYRYRTRQEVESLLRYKHPALSYLGDSDWQELWGIARVSWSNAEGQR